MPTVISAVGCDVYRVSFCQLPRTYVLANFIVKLTRLCCKLTFAAANSAFLVHTQLFGLHVKLLRLPPVQTWVHCTEALQMEGTLIIIHGMLESSVVSGVFVRAMSNQ